MVLYPGAAEGSTGRCSGIKPSQKLGLPIKVSSERLGEPGIDLGTTG